MRLMLLAVVASMGAVAAQAPPPGAVLDPSDFTYARAIRPGPAALVELPLDAAVLAHSRGPAAGFADVRIVDPRGRQLPYLLDEIGEPLEAAVPFRPIESDLPGLQSSEGHHRSTYLVTLPYASLPGGHLVLETPQRVFRRDVQLSIERPPDRRRRDRSADVIAASIWEHTDEHTPAPPLVLTAGNRDTTDRVITIDEGDNAPLPLASVRLQLSAWRIRFYRPADTPLRLLYGSRDAVTPAYDLALLRGTVMGEPAGEAVAEPEAAKKDRAAILSPPIFWGFLIAAVLVLIALVVRLATSRASEDPPPPSAPRP